MIRTSLAAAALLFAASSPVLAAPQLAPVWTDHVVIQRDVLDPHRRDRAAAGESVSGTLGDRAPPRRRIRGPLHARIPGTAGEQRSTDAHGHGPTAAPRP
jgi:hypothetical protein